MSYVAMLAELKVCLRWVDGTNAFGCAELGDNITGGSRGVISLLILYFNEILRSDWSIEEV